MTFIRILIVDDTLAYRSAFAAQLNYQTGLQVVGEAGTLAEARQWLSNSAEQIDIALVAGLLPDGRGQDLLPDLNGVFPACHLIVVRANESRRQTSTSYAAGAAAVFPSCATAEAIVDGIRRLSAGDLFLAHGERQSILRDAARYIAEEERIRSGFARLTPRECELLHALANGLSDKEIAARWGVSTKTVAAHMTSLFHKLDVDSRLQAVLAVVRYGFIGLD